MQKQLNNKQNIKAYSSRKEYIKIFLYCLAVQTAVFIASSIVALIIDIKSDNYYIFSIATLSFGSALSGFIAGRKIRKKGMLCGVIFALPTNLLYVLLSLAFNSFKVDYILAISLILLIVFSALGGILSVNIRTKINIKARR